MRISKQIKIMEGKHGGACVPEAQDMICGHGTVMLRKLVVNCTSHQLRVQVKGSVCKFWLDF